MSLHPIFADILKPFAPKEGQHQGRTITDLISLAEKARSQSSVDGCPSCRGWKVLVEAQLHLSDHVMTPGDVQAWRIMAELTDELLTEPEEYSILDKVRDDAVGGL